MLAIPKTISAEEINKLPLKGFEGDIITVDDARDLEGAIEYLSKQEIIGFDTETKPAFKKGVSYEVALLQLSTRDKAFLFRTNKIGLPPVLCNLLNNENIIKVGAAIRDDIKGLQKINKFVDRGFIELQNYASKLGIEVLSLKKLSALVLSLRISKRQRISNWEATELSTAQKKYAATDAWVSLEIYNKLKQLQEEEIEKDI